MPLKATHGKFTFAVKKKCDCNACKAYRKRMNKRTVAQRDPVRHKENQKRFLDSLAPEERSEYGKRWYRKNRDKKLKAHKEWYANNRDEERRKNRDRSKKQYEENPDKIKTRVAEWRKANKEKMNDIAQRRRARKQGQLGNVPPNIVEILWGSQKGLCFYCEANLDEVGFHRDHMVPLARGGLHDKKNLCLACPSCNLRKNKKTVKEFTEDL